MENEHTEQMIQQQTPDDEIEQTQNLRKVSIKIQKLFIFQVAILVFLSFNCLEESPLNLFRLKEWVLEREDVSFDAFCEQISNTQYYNLLYGDQLRENDQISYNQWLDQIQKEAPIKSTIFYLGLILFPLDLLVTLGLKIFFNEKLKKIQIIHYYVQTLLLPYFTWSVLSVIRFEQYFITTILILLFQLIVIFITNMGLLINNMYFQQQVQLKMVLQYVINGIAVFLLIVVQFTDISRLLVNQLAISVYLIYYFVQLDCSIQQIDQKDTEYQIWSNIVSGVKNIFSVNENYQEIAMTHFVISKKGLFKQLVGSIGIVISMVLSYSYFFNEGLFYLLSYIFISTLQTQVQDTQMKNRLQPSEEHYGVTQIPLDIIMPTRNLLRTLLN